MSDYIKIILPDGTEKYIRKISFDNGFQVIDDKYGIKVANLNYQGGLDYEYAKNIYDLSQYEWKSVAPNDKWNNAIVYAVKNNTSNETISFKLHLNTTIPISKGLMNSNLSDVIIIDEDGNLLPWYYESTETFGEFDIVVTADIPKNGGIKNFFVLFGNDKCLGVFKKPSDANIVKLPFNLDKVIKYRIYSLNNQDTSLQWTSDGNNGYVDVSSLSNDEIFVVERDDENGLSASNLDITNTVVVNKMQWLQPEPTTLLEPDVKVILVRSKFLPTWPYYWRFDITNDDTTNTLEGQVCIEFDSSNLVMNGYMKPDGRDIRLAVVETNGKPIQMLDYYLETETVGSKNTRLWTKLNIAPSGNIHLALMFGNPYTYSESSGTKVFDFFDDFRLKNDLPLISVTEIPNGVKKVIVQNTYDKKLNKVPIKLPSKAPHVLSGYFVTNGYSNFDNNNNGKWKYYINIPITTSLSEDIQYKIVIDGDTISVYSNDGTESLVNGIGGNTFWNNVTSDGHDIRVFNESFAQNYFWIEEFDYSNQKCILWIKINTGQEQVNIAYGNSDCLISSYHSGEQTFEFFDDFEVNNGWSVDSGDTTLFGVDGTWLRIYDDDGSIHYAYKDIGLQPGQVVEYKLKMPSATQPSARVFFLQDSSFSEINYLESHEGSGGGGLSSNIENLYYRNSIGKFSISSTSMYKTLLKITPSLTVYKRTYEIGNESNFIEGSYNNWINDGGCIKFQVGFGNTYTCDFYVDYIFVRKYANQDLSFDTPTIKQL